MNREEFLAALQAELADVSEEERGEALKFYTEFLDEAGPDREQQVIGELGSPQRVANIIRANLGLPGIAGVQAGQAAAGCGPEPELPETPAAGGAPAAPREGEGRPAGGAAEQAAAAPDGPAGGPRLTLEGPDWSAGRAQQAACTEGAAGAEGRSAGGPAYARPHPYDYAGQAAGRRGGSRWVWVVLLVLTCPIWIGLLGGVLGLVLGVLGAVIGVGAGGIGAIAGGAMSLVSALTGLLFGTLASPLDAVVDLGLGVTGIALGSLMVALCAWLLGTAAPALWRMARRFFGGLLGGGN